MSVSGKQAAARNIANILKRWPDKSVVFTSFKSTMLPLYEKPDIPRLPSEATLKARAAALEALMNDKNMNKFPITNRLLRPKGNPQYYEKIVGEATRTEGKVGFFTMIKDIAFGWFR